MAKQIQRMINFFELGKCRPMQFINHLIAKNIQSYSAFSQCVESACEKESFGYSESFQFEQHLLKRFL